MQYLNLSQAKGAWERWQELSTEQRLTIKWGLLTLLIGVVFLISQKTVPENPVVFRYFVSLYTINSVVFFLIFRQYLALGRTMLVFLLTLEAVVTLFYLFTFLSADVQFL